MDASPAGCANDCIRYLSSPVHASICQTERGKKGGGVKRREGGCKIHLRIREGAGLERLRKIMHKKKKKTTTNC